MDEELNNATLEQALALNYNQLRSTKVQVSLSQRELIEQKSILQLKSEAIQNEYGSLMEKKNDPKRPQSRWDYVLKEVVEQFDYLTQRRAFFKNKCKKLAEQAVTRRQKYKEAQLERRQNQIRMIQKQSEQLSKIVEREFWKNCHKIMRQNDIAMRQRIEKRSQEQKLDVFVAKLHEVTDQIALKLEQYRANQSMQHESIDVEKYRIYYMDQLLGQKFSKQRKIFKRKLQPNSKPSNIYINLKKIGQDRYLVFEIEQKEQQSISDNCLDADACLLQLKESQNAIYQNLLQKHQDQQNQIQQPYLIKGTLRNYQLIGMQWIISLQQKQMNGILADEMGLGKTIQTISSLAYMASNYGIWGPHLVVVPTSILVNWEIEFKRWCPAFKILTYFGSPKERKLKRAGWSQPNFFHVCITSYKLVIQDSKIFRRKRWQCMILDEAQHIKNFRSQRWQVLLNFNTRYRLLLTGTPLQNDLGEVWSLLHFLMPVVFDNHQEFLDWFGGPIEKALFENKEVHTGLLTKLHAILRPFVLRRLKKDVEKQLPEKKEVIIKCTLSRRQRYLYDEFIQRSGNVQITSTDFVSVMNIVQQLRKVCNHPELFEQRPVASAFMMQRINLNMPAMVCDLIPKCSILLTPINQQIVERQLSLFPNAFKIKEVLNKLGMVPVSSKLGLRWASTNTNEKHHRVKQNFKIMFERVIKQHSAINGFYLKIDKLTKSEMILQTTEQLLDKLYQDLNEFTVFQPKVEAPPVRVYLSPYKQQPNFDSNLIKPIVDVLFPQILRQKLVFPNKKFLIYDCGKLNQMLQLIKKLKSEGHKIILFTQMTKMLDILESVLSMSKISYLRLDGSTGVELRQRQVERFNQDPRVTCFISSTRSGGIGINLTGADTVIFYDTDWNPAMDKQAQDRCHRIGQTREVTIYRLISSSTIEENILMKSMQKRQLNTLVMESGFFSTEQLITGKAAKLLEESLNAKGVDFDKALERVEDKEDAQAAKQAQLEELNQQQNGFEEIQQINQPEDTLEWLQPQFFPPVMKYGLRYLEMVRDEPDHQMEEEEDDENEDDDDDDEDESEDHKQSERQSSNLQKEEGKNE